MKFSFLKKNLKFIGILLLIVLVIFISVRGADNPVKSAVFTVANPFLKIFRGFSEGFHGFLAFLGSIGRLKNENENLIKKNLELTTQVARLQDAEKENELLRQEINLAPRNKFGLEAAFVVGEDSISSPGSIIIDKGSNQGVAEGMAAIVSNGILVGKVSRVFSNNAEITLITAKDSAVNGEILESGAKGIIKGTYGLGLSMDMISQTEVIKEGDSAISSGLGGGMPRGLFIGKVEAVSQSTDKLFQQAELVSPVDPSSLRIIFIVKKF